MIQLSPETIRLGAQPKTKEEAIQQAGQILVDSGHIAPEYVQSMLGREQQANTYLGNGIAIPHGMGKDRELIEKTGIAVLQVPGGVSWNTDETAFLVVGIAARSDEHLGILARLVSVLEDTELVLQLAQTTNAHEIAQGLNQAGAEDATAATEDWADVPTAEVVLANKAGLHARPATAFIEVAKRFTAEVRVVHGEKTANGKALASLLKLGVEGGSTLVIQARGADADAALQALVTAVEQGLEEEDEKSDDVVSESWTPISNNLKAVTGVAASPGIAIGVLHHFKSSSVTITDDASDPQVEKRHLHQSLATAEQQLDDVYESVKARAGKGEAAIFQAHKSMIDDPDIVAEVEQAIDAGHSAAWGWQQVINQRVEELKQIDDERLAGRAADMHDVGQRVLRLLAGVDEADAAAPDQPVIVIADDLLPSDTARLDPQQTLGLCTASGGPTSHTAIIARSLGIPAVVGAGAALLEQTDGTSAILDGAAGHLYLEPDEENIVAARQFEQRLNELRDVEHRDRYQPALTTDGYRVEVVANIGKAPEAARAVDAGAEGVGLLRTEFLFLERDTPPSEEEQYEAYTTMTKALNGLPLIIRTLDIGGDKNVPYITVPHEDNPFLGVRGVRLCLQMPELFRPQLRAIYRAAKTGPVRIMFPMVATLEDVRAAKAVAEEVRQEVDGPVVDIGIMVEVPSTAMLADVFADEVDFFSVGTNDLTQYALAIDRLHPTLAPQVDGLHPAVLRLIDQTVQAASAKGKWVGVCGGVAGEPLGAVILTGMGVTELSMSIPSVAAVKARLRQISHRRAQELAQRALAARTAAEVRSLPLA